MIKSIISDAEFIQCTVFVVYILFASGLLGVDGKMSYFSLVLRLTEWRVVSKLFATN